MRRWIKPFEFWHPRLFEMPFYFYLILQCLLNRVGLRGLAKANYVLDHGEIGIGSKFHTQNQFDQSYFLPTQLIDGLLATNKKIAQIKAFANEYGFPVIVKPDIGLVGKGILKLHDENEVEQRTIELEGNYILQQFTPMPLEYGVFYIRRRGKPQITGINRKHFPTVIGNGYDSILTLASKHYRFTHHWQTFLQYIDTSRVPALDEVVKLSFIGSHTMGCMFTDDTHLLNPVLERAVFALFEQQEGYNFGRMDVKVESEEAFLKGKFKVIEVNGISSLPTHMFDPKYSLFKAYKIFFEHGKYLVQIACEYQAKSMTLLPLLEVARKVKNNQGRLDKLHSKLKSR